MQKRNERHRNQVEGDRTAGVSISTGYDEERKVPLNGEIRWVDLSSIFKSEGIEKNNAIIKVTAGRASKFKRSQWKR